MSLDTAPRTSRGLWWTGSAWVAAPGDATNGAKVQSAQLPAALVGGRLSVDGSGVTQPVSAASLPLPSGAAQEHATAASPHSARLTDGATYLGSTAQRLHVSDGGVALAVSGPLTDTQLRASAVPVSGTVTASGPLTDTQLRASAVPVSGPLTDTQLRASAVPVSMATQSPDVTDRDARLLGRVKNLDSAGAVIDPALKGQLPAALVGGRLDVNIGGASATPTVANAETIADNAGFTDGTSKVFPAGYIFDDVAGTALTENDVAAARINVNRAGVTVLEDGATRGRYGTVKAASTAVVAGDTAQAVGLHPSSPVPLPTLTKGTQGATGVSTQELRDAGRNPTNYFHAAPIITTTAEVMQTLTGYKSGAAVAATATPAVVTASKTYRIERITVAYIAATVIGGALLRLRANLSGVAVVGSPLVWATYVGLAAAFVAGEAMTYVFDFPEGLEFAAGTGIALGVIGGGAVPTTGTITGYVMASIEGYEY